MDSNNRRKGKDLRKGKPEDRRAAQTQIAIELAKLVAQPGYKYLKELGMAIADADFIPAPKDLNDAIRFHFWATRKATMEALFKTVEATAGSAATLSDSQRPKGSLFSEKDFTDL